MKPHIIYLKADADVTTERRKNRGGQLDNVESLGNSHQEKVARNFEELLQEKDLYHQTWIVDANQDTNGVQAQLETIFSELFRYKGTILQFFPSSDSAIIPTKGSLDAAGWDLYASQKHTIPAYDSCKVHTDLHIAFPPGYYARIASRSGLAFKHKVVTQGGVVDEGNAIISISYIPYSNLSVDYRGEVGVILFNHSNRDFEVKPGDRIAQLILEKIADNVQVETVSSIEELGQTDRGHGGFGSSGN